jgi:hypothetical protein
MLRTLEKAGIELPQLPAPVKAKRAKLMKGYWAKMTAAERSAEMARRKEVTQEKRAAKPRVKLVQPNHPRNAGHPKHEEWLAKTRRANRKSWASMTPEARKARIDAAQAGRGLKPKS